MGDRLPAIRSDRNRRTQQGPKQPRRQCSLAQIGAQRTRSFSRRRKAEVAHEQRNRPLSWGRRSLEDGPVLRMKNDHSTVAGSRMSACERRRTDAGVQLQAQGRLPKATLPQKATCGDLASAAVICMRLVVANETPAPSEEDPNGNASGGGGEVVLNTHLALTACAKRDAVARRASRQRARFQRRNRTRTMRRLPLEVAYVAMVAPSLRRN
uniref:Uncharacterized protein n=1 Tax=Trichuris muris TaxID=70415 RepID=A0A5S6R591_TRIMR